MNNYPELLDTIAQASHDIKNILSIIGSSYQFIDEHYPQTSDFNLWNTLGNAINSMTKYMEQTTVLRYSNSISITDKINLNNLIWELPDFMDEIYDPAANIGIRNYNFNLEDSDCFVMGDYDKLKIAFIEILKNAFEATSDGDSISIESTIEDKSIIISFFDNGVGIPSDILKNVTKPLYSTKTNHAGAGLTITGNIVDLHNGSLEISSLPSKTCVSVRLPIL